MQGLNLSTPRVIKSGGGSFKKGNKTSNFMKGVEFDQWQYYQLIKNVAAL